MVMWYARVKAPALLFIQMERTPKLTAAKPVTTALTIIETQWRKVVVVNEREDIVYDKTKEIALERKYMHKRANDKNYADMRDEFVKSKAQPTDKTMNRRIKQKVDEEEATRI